MLTCVIKVQDKKPKNIAPLTLNVFYFYVMDTPPRELQNILFDDISGAYMPQNVRLDL
jgi:hypothetical protein